MDINEQDELPRMTETQAVECAYRRGYLHGYIAGQQDGKQGRNIEEQIAMWRNCPSDFKTHEPPR